MYLILDADLPSQLRIKPRRLCVAAGLVEMAFSFVRPPAFLTYGLSSIAVDK